MRGVRGGFKDQIKAFREFLIRKKKKKKKEEELLRLRKKKEEEKKNRQFVDNTDNVLENLFGILSDIYDGKKLNYAQINSELDIMKKDKNNVSLKDKIEEVSERVETEILYEEIISDNVVLLSTNGVNNDKNNSNTNIEFNDEVVNKIDCFIYLSTKYINKSDNIKEVSHYYNNVSNVYNKHVNIKNDYKKVNVIENNKHNNDVLEKSDIDRYIIKEESLLLLADNKLEVLKIDNSNNFNFDGLKYGVLNDSLNAVAMGVTYDLNVSQDGNKEEIIGLEQDDDLSNDFVSSDNLEKNVIKELDDEKKDFFDFSEFDIINQSVKEQILISEIKVNQLRRQVENINDLFKNKGLVEKVFDFGYNMFNLGRGLIGKYVFNNKLVGRLNSEILINNSLKGIHRVFVDDKKEVPYIVFKSFEKDINDKKDCVAKILDICDDSLSEIMSLKSDFLNKYGNLDNEQVKEFLDRIQMYQTQVEKRKEEVKRIQVKVQEKYRMNKQKVKVKK